MPVGVPLPGAPVTVDVRLTVWPELPSTGDAVVVAWDVTWLAVSVANANSLTKALLKLACNPGLPLMSIGIILGLERSAGHWKIGRVGAPGDENVAARSECEGGGSVSHPFIVALIAARTATQRRVLDAGRSCIELGYKVFGDGLCNQRSSLRQCVWRFRESRRWKRCR